MTGDYSGFPLFTRLPTELRLQIWNSVLPDTDTPALFHYVHGCWRPRYLKESDEGYHPTLGDNIALEFRHELLNDVPVDLPLAYVNREARGIALTWALEQGIHTDFNNRQCQFTRRFNPNRDVLYIPLDKVDVFSSEPYDRMFEPDLIERNISSGPNVIHIAVPEAVVRDENAILPDVIEWFLRLRVLLAVADPQPAFGDDDSAVPRRWELERIHEGGFFWNYERREFTLEDGSLIRDEILDDRIVEVSKGIAKNMFGGFEYRPVSAVEKGHTCF